MKTLEYFSDPLLRDQFLPAFLAGLALAVLCSLLSVLVVLKRMAFIGQGISHAAFGGIGTKLFHAFEVKPHYRRHSAYADRNGILHISSAISDRFDGRRKIQNTGGN